MLRKWSWCICITWLAQMFSCVEGSASFNTSCCLAIAIGVGFKLTTWLGGCLSGILHLLIYFWMLVPLLNDWAFFKSSMYVQSLSLYKGKRRDGILRIGYVHLFLLSFFTLWFFLWMVYSSIEAVMWLYIFHVWTIPFGLTQFSFPLKSNQFIL